MKLTTNNNSEDKFIGLYNELHKKISELSEPYFHEVADGVIIDKFIEPGTAQHYLKDGFIPFMKAVHVVKNSNEFIRRKLTEFYKINELRNLIVHDYEEGYQIVKIAQPTEYSLNLISETLDKLNNPLTVEEFLKAQKNEKVESVNMNTNIYELFQLIQGNKYTQFPVFDNENFKGIVSDNGITFKLSQFALEEKEFETLDLSTINVSDFISLDEQRYHYKIIHGDEYLYNILSEFEITSDQQSPPVLLIQSTDDLSEDLTPDSLIGILTSFDYFDIYKEAISNNSF
ncbi:CBS domain-containing protein [Aerococcus viridans]